ncbi:hypothetical protein EJ110_NYTH15545 [Nymphaea thermarum]|nr:hypothetical protein EJ110_NYTH15545 [Nymphaea thermarum]
MMARFTFEMVLWGARTIFVVVGFLSFLDSLDMKAIFFSSVPDLGASISSLLPTSLSYISSFSSSFHRPYVDIAVGCIAIILLISSKKYSKPSKERREKTQKGGELLMRLPSLPLLACHQHPEPPMLASPPQTSGFMAYPTEGSPTKSDLLYHHSLKTKLVGSFLKHPTMAETRPLQSRPSPSESKPSRELDRSARISGKRSMSVDYRSLNETPVRIGGVGSISFRHAARDAAMSSLPQEATLVAPSLWKPLPDDQLFLLDEDLDFLEGDLDSSPLLPSPWPVSDSESEEELREAHDSSGSTCWGITAGPLLKKYDKWNSPELDRGTTRRSITKKSEMFRGPNTDPSRRAMSRPKSFSKPQTLHSLSGSMRWRQPLEKEELQRRSDAFIKKMRNDLLLEHQESEQQYRDMISRGTA